MVNPNKQMSTELVSPEIELKAQEVEEEDKTTKDMEQEILSSLL